jgi:hypothetical protein
MRLYWVVRRTGDGQKLFYLQHADSPLDAARKSAAAGFEGFFADVFRIDSQTAARIKEQDIGCVLSMDEAIIDDRRG